MGSSSQAASSQATAFKLQPDDPESVESFIKEISNLVEIPATLRYRPLVSYALQISRVPSERRTDASAQWLMVYGQTPHSTFLDYIATRVVQAEEHPHSVLRLAMKEGVISSLQFREQYIVGKEAEQWLDKMMRDWLTSAWTRSIENTRLAAVSRATGAAGMLDLVQQARQSPEEQNTPQHDLI
ncbi:hypothetical protein CEP51_016651 [Fusarium floridanum]|uniref:Uncharacterized protein n=1 Tax=Fusarium floridanum TaxID=1325733 RepID=A0A428NJ59_9HYPO|nr:hypothetical protein CEP51_016651 [Fusarium floridanum]